MISGSSYLRALKGHDSNSLSRDANQLAVLPSLSAPEGLPGPCGVLGVVGGPPGPVEGGVQV